MINLTPMQAYQNDLQRDDFHYDEAQERAIQHLQRVYDDLVDAETKLSKGLLSRFGIGKKAKRKVKGLYFWGGVGRGKTYLVDTFFECLPMRKKMRVHFHRFMHRVHAELQKLKGESDPLPKIAAILANEAEIICFDEFYVSDITDAMILGTLMESLFARGVVLIATSNIVPDDLYKNGLQRARFLPAIALINQHCDIVNVDSGIDYRLRTLEQAEIYHFPLDAAANANLEQYFQQLSVEPRHYNQSIEINNRQIPTQAEADGILHISFEAMCQSARSQIDYMEISRIYNTVLLADVLPMGKDTDDVARRFIAMVDEFYERNVTLIMSAQVAMDDLYGEGGLTFEFRRCLSRLREMQSKEYLGRAHLP